MRHCFKGFHFDGVPFIISILSIHVIFYFIPKKVGLAKARWPAPLFFLRDLYWDVCSKRRLFGVLGVRQARHPLPLRLSQHYCYTLFLLEWSCFPMETNHPWAVHFWAWFYSIAWHVSRLWDCLDYSSFVVMICNDRGNVRCLASFYLSRLLSLLKIFYTFISILEYICQICQNKQPNKANNNSELGIWSMDFNL